MTPDTKQGEGLGEATPYYLPKTDAIMAALKSGEAVLKSPEDELAEENAVLKQRVKVLEEALGKIAKPSGAFNRDELTFARNVIMEMVDIAKEALAPPVGEKGK